jgi:predicted DCC family thiol-disulfide oxidoreductase YuxK
MQCLYVLYDERCGLCRTAKVWASTRAAYVPLVFLAAGSDEARRRLLGLNHSAAPEELVAVSDEGEVYRNDAAWIMCLYALEETREWSLRLATPLLRPLARQAFTAISHGRCRLSQWLGLDDHGAAAELRRVPLPACELSATASPLQRVHELVAASSESENEERSHSFRIS